MLIDDIRKGFEAFCKATGGIPPSKIMLTQDTYDQLKKELKDALTLLYPDPDECFTIFGMTIEKVNPGENVIARITQDNVNQDDYEWNKKVKQARKDIEYVVGLIHGEPHWVRNPIKERLVRVDGLLEELQEDE